MEYLTKIIHWQNDVPLVADEVPVTVPASAATSSHQCTDDQLSTSDSSESTSDVTDTHACMPTCICQLLL